MKIFFAIAGLLEILCTEICNEHAKPADENRNLAVFMNRNAHFAVLNAAFKPICCALFSQR
jgi:hypothetical protein